MVVIALWFVFVRGGGPSPPANVEASADWGVVVEMGCEPQDLQRVLRKRSQHPKNLRTVQADSGDGESCFRLVWGSFPSRESAEAAIEDVPSGLLEDGFHPHVVEVNEAAADDRFSAED
jgi:hypothetical protein